MSVKGPLHKVNVKFVTKATLKKVGKPKKDEAIVGLYIPEKNLIYVDRDLPDAEKLHTLAHEWAHAIDYQTSGLEEEQRCDVMGMLIIHILGATCVQDLLEE